MKVSLVFLILFSLILFSTNLQAQPTTYGNFKLVSQEMIYQKIFVEDSITFEKLADFYSQLPNVSSFDRSNDEIAFKLVDLIVDYKKFQFSQVATPSVIQTGKYSGDVSVDVKGGKYRVTVTNLQFTGDLGYKKVTQNESLTKYACRDNGTYISQDWSKPNTLGLLDKALTDKLQYISKDDKKGKGEW